MIAEALDLTWHAKALCYRNLCDDVERRGLPVKHDYGRCRSTAFFALVSLYLAFVCPFVPGVGVVYCSVYSSTVCIVI
jgi:hypothetical protein